MGTFKAKLDTFHPFISIIHITTLLVQVCSCTCVISYTETSCVIQGETIAAIEAQPRLHNEDILRDGLCLL